MRTDAIIDKRQVHCPNASTLGFSKWKAQFGDIVQWKDETGHCYIGRVCGRVKYAPGEPKPIRDHLLVMALGSDLSFPMERWVDPNEVYNIYNPQDFGSRDMVKFMSFFFGAEFRSITPQALRAYAAGETIMPQNVDMGF